MKRWRCELTALSRVYNLYFVAWNDRIRIYQPGFPNQTLSVEPVWTLTVPATGVPTPPGIDLEDPHSINRLHVDYLGNSEILLIACDDGDIVGYRTSNIHQAIKNKQDAGMDQDGVDQDGMRCFELQNIGASAWGLAVHREARLIAISANTHVVKVIAYALSKPDESPGHAVNRTGLPLTRHENCFITLNILEWKNTGNGRSNFIDADGLGFHSDHIVNGAASDDDEAPQTEAEGHEESLLTNEVSTGSFSTYWDEEYNLQPHENDKHPYCAFDTADFLREASIEADHDRPLIIVTKEEIYMFQRPFDLDVTYSSPILTIRNPLFSWEYPKSPPAINEDSYHRQCYVTQIPELSIFIVASPAHRVGIFRLTKTMHNGKPFYAFRLDTVIFEHQPGLRLVGIAVSPIQGMLDREEGEVDAGEERAGGARRWRLLLYSEDHTVRSYELGKYTGEEEPALDDLVV
ncbi:Mitochondrial DNA replication protein yhm2 [Kalmusia sp. IMI 367209]|nr:Mitochondrial DNA replication protein yhm2 [Kalmusia sp. IMI 367209]